MKPNALFWIYLSIFIISLSLGAYNPLIPLFAQQLGANYFELGLIGSAWALPYVLLPISIGVLSKKIDSRWIFFVGLASSAANAALFLLARNVSDLLLIRIFGGIAYALMWPTVEAIISDLTTNTERAKAMGRYAFAFGMGFLIGPAAGGLILERAGFTALFSISLLIGLLATLIATRCLKAPRKIEVETQSEAKTIFPIKALAPLYLAIAAYSLAMGIIFSLYPAYASNRGVSSAEIGILFAILGLVRVAVFLQSERVSKIGEHRVLFTALFVQAIILPVMPYLHGFFAMLIGMAVFGFTLGILSPISISAVSKMVSSDKIGVAIGAVEAFFGLGWTLGPLIGGIAAENIGTESPYLIAGLISLLVSIPVILQSRYPKA